MIAVTFALPTESSEFVRVVRSRDDVCVIHTGVGRKISAERIGAAFASGRPPDVLISAGFAGAVDEQLSIGDLLLAENFSDPELLATAATALRNHPHRVAKLATVDAVMDTASERRDAAAKTGAVAVDMETESLRDACVAASVPLLSLRVISDTPAAPLPAPAAVLFDIEQQRTPAARLALYVLRNPPAIARLIGFAQRVAACRKTLAHALDLVLSSAAR
jgi:nucleoside phosphorylase